MSNCREVALLEEAEDGAERRQGHSADGKNKSFSIDFSTAL